VSGEDPGEVWDRLESLEDMVCRLVWKLQYPEGVKRFASEDAYIESLRRFLPYKAGDPKHWKRNNP
jgi:hypothetical protein